MGSDLPDIEADRKAIASYIAAVVRDAMEDFHCRHLSDEQMAELNPIIRNAIYTALHAMDSVRDCDVSSRFIDGYAERIPAYWEPPELLPAFRRMLENAARG